MHRRARSLSRCARPAFKYLFANLLLMMMDMARPTIASAYDYQRLDRIREKFYQVFGRECTLRDDVLLKRYNLSPDGELIMFIR
jgi:hypothetical protein